MITWVRTANVHDGQLEEAFAWALKAAAYINKKVKGANVQVMRNLGGPLYQIYWVSSHDSLAAFETQWKQIESDRGYRNLIREVRKKGLLIGTSVVDSLYESVS